MSLPTETTFPLKILRAVLVTGSGPDHLLLTVDLPEGEFPFNPSNALLKLTVAAGTGERYLADNFGLRAEVIHRGC